jgi:hypothetical protein
VILPSAGGFERIKDKGGGEEDQGNQADLILQGHLSTLHVFGTRPLNMETRKHTFSLRTPFICETCPTEGNSRITTLNKPGPRVDRPGNVKYG